jgi:plastocyanin domain-containing protein
MTARRVVRTTAAAAFMVLLGLACGKKGDSSKESSSGSTGAMLAAVTGQARVVAGEHGFTPSSLALPRGAPGSKASVVFVRTTDKTCATEVVFPDLDVKKDLPLDTPVSIDVPTDTARTLTFQCGMAMYKGALVVR